MSTIETEVLPRLGLESAGISMTPEEFDAIVDCDENYNYELIHGVLIVTPVSSRSERSPNELLGHWLWIYQTTHPQGAWLIETLPEEYIRTRSGRRRADRAIWTILDGHSPDPLVDPPSIAVEFVSSGRRAWRRDYVEKRDEYLEADIQQYWLIDRFEKVMTVFSRRDGKLIERVTREGETFATTLLPGFEFCLADLLAAAARWRETS